MLTVYCKPSTLFHNEPDTLFIVSGATCNLAKC